MLDIQHASGASGVLDVAYATSVGRGHRFEVVPHGQWEAWVKARSLATVTAWKYMKLAKSFSGKDLPPSADPTYRDAGIDKRPALFPCNHGKAW